MTYGTIKVDTVTFTNAGVDKSVTLSGLVQNPTFSGNVTVTGTLSGVTVTGTTANFTSGNFTNISGGTHTITSGVFAAGSAASPSITFTGDLNTGIYSPGADQVAISTGGSGRLFVDSSGRLGVGTSSPVSTLSIRNDSLGSGGLTETAIALTYSSTNYGQHFIDANGTYNIYANTNGVAGGNLQLRADASLLFNTASNERLRITSAGLVGVGTSSPNCLLEVKGGSAITTLANSYTNCGVLHQYSSTSLLAIGNDGTSPILQGVNATNNTARNLLLNPLGGSVGIGISSPNTALDVNGTINVRTNGFEFGRITTNNVSGVDGGLSFQTILGGTFSTKMVLDASGRVGIGTTSPSGKLTVVSAVAGGTDYTNEQVSIFNSQTGVAGNQATLGFHLNNANWGSATTYARVSAVLENGTTGATALAFGTAADGSLATPNERARIDSSGRLLVGTSSSFAGNSIFQVASTNNVVAQFYRSGAQESAIDLGSTTGTLGSPSALVQGTGMGAIYFSGYDGAAWQYGAFIIAQADGQTWASGDCPTRLVFSTTKDGGSSPLARLRISNTGAMGTSSSGNGIVYSVTAGAGTSTFFIAGNYSGTEGTEGSGTTSFYVWSNGNVQNTNNSYTAISDIKLKENVVNANSQWDDIKSLQVRNYNLKEGQTHRQIGLIAQEVEPISPGLVYESPDRDAEGNDLGTVTKSVNYSVLYMKAVKALQEAMERIELLEARLDAANL